MGPEHCLAQDSFFQHWGKILLSVLTDVPGIVGFSTVVFPSPVLALRILPYKPFWWSEPSVRYIYIYMLISTWIPPGFSLCPGFSTLALNAQLQLFKPWRLPVPLPQASAGARGALTLVCPISGGHRPLPPMSLIAASPPLAQPPVVVNNNSLCDTFQPKLSEKTKKLRYQVSCSSFKWKCSKTPGIYFGSGREMHLENKIIWERILWAKVVFLSFSRAAYTAYTCSLFSVCGLKCQPWQELIFPNHHRSCVNVGKEPGMVFLSSTWNWFAPGDVDSSTPPIPHAFRPVGLERGKSHQNSVPVGDWYLF